MFIRLKGFKEPLTKFDLKTILISGSRPLYFQEQPNSPIQTGGSSFLVKWKNEQFLITARHIIENIQANIDHLRIRVPDYEGIIPVKANYGLSDFDEVISDELEDLLVFHLDSDFDAEQYMAWDAWRLDQFIALPSLLKVGEDIYAAGFPSDENRINYDTNEISESSFVAKGIFLGNVITDSLFSIETAAFEEAQDLDGISGGPVMAIFDGYFCFIGMITRAGAPARRIHFISSEHITSLLNHITDN